MASRRRARGGVVPRSARGGSHRSTRVRTCPLASPADITIIPHDTIRAGRRTVRVAARLAMEVAMKVVLGVLGLLAVLVGGGVAAHAQDAGKKFGDAVFLRYEGTQSWPVGER